MLNNTLNFISLSLAFSLIGLSVFVTKRILNITDITCDASVAIGGCAYGVFLFCGTNPLLAFLSSTALGGLAGLVTSSMIVQARISPILASIICVAAVQSIVAKLIKLGKAAVERVGVEPLLGGLSSLDNFAITAVVVIALSGTLYYFLLSEYGLSMRVYGSGRAVAESLGVNSKQVLIVGVCIASLLASVGGVLVTQISRAFSDDMGIGTFIFGFGSVIIGEKFVRTKNVGEAIIGSVIGAFLYKIMLCVLIGLGGASVVGYEYTSIITATVLACLLSLSRKAGKIRDEEV